MSLFADYIQERLNKGIIESEDGFATYIIANEEVYIEDIYIVPAKRNTGLAAKMADEIAEIAKAKGCTVLVGSVAPQANGATDSLKVLLGYGMTLHSVQANGLIYFVKGIV